MERDAMFTTPDLTPYNDAARLCRTVFECIKERVFAGETSVRDLCDFGDTLIMEHTAAMYKKESHKGVGFPVCISLNDCVGFYRHEDGDAAHNTIRQGDVVKVELGVHIAGCCARYADTFVFSREIPHEYAKVLELLDALPREIAKQASHGTTNDDVRMHIESRCADAGVVPVPNCMTTQQSRDVVDLSNDQDGKTMLLNVTHQFDECGDPIGPDNICYDLLENEVYCFNITVTLDDLESPVKLVQRHAPHVYRFNECFYNLKLKHARAFCSTVKETRRNFPFDFNVYKHDPKHRMGMKEAVSGGIIDAFDVLYSVPSVPVFTKKFTLVVGKEKGLALKY